MAGGLLNMLADCKQLFNDILQEKKEKLKYISEEIWKNPESSFHEIKAHDLLTRYLKDEGFDVECNFIAPTGFKAVFTQNGDQEKSINACFLCEYDAVAEVGHAAGHHLRTEASIAAAVCIKHCLKDQLFPGKVTILGTPGEDCGCGTKIEMVSKGVFTDVDFCLMPTPFNQNILFPKHFTMVVASVKYKGKAAHASSFPWEGRNALDAAVACYNNIALMRQQLKPTWSINGIILSGGVAPNVIPQYSEMKFWLRAPHHTDLCLIQQKCTACFVAAGKATGCEIEFDFEDHPYYPMEHNQNLGEIYKQYAQENGIEFTEEEEVLQTHIGSTDFGNVSQVVPCISPTYDIKCGKHVVINSEAFHHASNADIAHEATLSTAKALAMTVVEVMTSPRLLEPMLEEHRGLHESSSGSMLIRMQSVESN